MRRLSEPLALARTVKQLNAHNPDAMRFARSLVTETVRRQNFIDAFIERAIEPSSLEDFNLGVQAFLRLYVYQTRLSSDWPKIDLKEAETITRLARSILGWQTLQRIEPFLGTLLIQKLEAVVELKNDADRVALQTFHPVWFVEYCFRLFGRREALAILGSDLTPPPLYVRINTLRAGSDEVLYKLREEGVEVESVEESSFTYRVVKARKPITETTCLREGLIHMQDRSDSVVAEASNPRRGSTVLDVCCAPGVITAQLGQIMRNDGLIISVDYSRRRMAVWNRQVQSAGVKIAEPIIADTHNPLPVALEADLVVLDPPCTGTGMFSRLPSFKWRLSPRSIDRMADIQWQMLDNCASHVKSGGTLIYSTSSITVEENELIIEKFLKWHPEFSLVEISPKTGLPGLRGFDKCQRLYPHINHCNGLFVAKLVKGNS